jgi:predicted ester cyclase
VSIDNEQIIRNAYQMAEDQDLASWVNAFTEDGQFLDASIGVTYRGPDELGTTVEVYAKAFPDMHREIHAMWSVGNTVFVELSLQGTHNGPLPTPFGKIPPTGRRMDTPCFDAFTLVDGKIKTFHCYPSGTVLFTQLGVLNNLEGAASA